MDIKVAGAYLPATPYLKVSGVYKAVSPYLKVGGEYKQVGMGVSPLRVATTMNLLPASRTTKPYTHVFCRFPLEVIGGDKKYLVAGFNNFYRTTDTNSPIMPIGNDVTIVRAAIEKSDGSSYAPITFNGGEESITLPDLSVKILSDKILPESLDLTSFTVGSKFFVRLEVQLPSTSSYLPLNTPNYNYTGQTISWYDPASTTINNGAYSTGVLTYTGTAPTTGGAGICPIWLGEPVDPATDKSWVVMGSSVEYGFSDGEQWNISGSSGMGYVSRALRTLNCSMLNLAIPGATTLTFEMYDQYIKPWMMHGRYMFDGVVSNDISGPRTSAEIINSLENRYAYAKSVGYDAIVRNSLGMRTNSTDGWATPGNQTYYSGWGPGSKADEIKQYLDAGVSNGLYDYITSTPSYRAAGDLWKWATNGTANYPTADGTHPKAPMHVLMSGDIQTTLSLAMA